MPNDTPDSTAPRSRRRAAQPRANPEPAATSQRGIQSVEVGGQLLLALAHSGGSMALKDLASDAGMAPGKAHPYLVSFGKLGLVAQDEASGRYGLGPLAMQLGLMSLQQYDPVRLAAPLLRELTLQLGHTVGIAVWGHRGATIVRIEEAPFEIHVNMRHGTVMSTRSTASGRVFAAYLPPRALKAALAEEDALAALAPPPVHPVVPALSAREFQAELALVRAHGLGRSVDAVVPGISAMAAPVFDLSGAIALSLIAIGPTAIFDARFDGLVGTTLSNCAQSLSRQLGAPADRV